MYSCKASEWFSHFKEEKRKVLQLWFRNKTLLFSLHTNLLIGDFEVVGKGQRFVLTEADVEHNVIPPTAVIGTQPLTPFYQGPDIRDTLELPG